ncbi:MAG: metallophosphoesterase [Oscillospiraceae bacterium]|jgi:predicted MPP superfamily phosphohydrolase|nr:metallophosphoesterase [Oscillospiraceae bacterium]
MEIVTNLFLRFVGFLLSTLLVWTVRPGAAVAPEANQKLRFSVMSDVHMETYTFARFQGFAQALANTGRGKTRQDALVLLGDNTMNGQVTEYWNLYGLLSRYNGAKTTLVAVGNHDLNHKESNAARHKNFLRAYSGIQSKKIWYSKEINGYRFVVLGDEAPQEDTTATLGQDQLRFLDGELKAAGGNPVFVFMHQPINGMFGDWSGVGAQSAQLQAILETYPNVFYFSGHLHTPADQITIRQNNSVTYIDVPSLLSEDITGVGYQVEVYDSRVVLRARDYINGAWWGDSCVAPLRR